MLRQRTIGSVLMILGTCIGAGMIALPIVTAKLTISASVLLLIGSWLLMTLGAMSILEVNLWMRPGSNLVTMSKQTLGAIGKLITWITYLLLLYSLICAYLAGSGDILHTVLQRISGIKLPEIVGTITSLAIISLIVCRGIGTADLFNRMLMSVKLIAYSTIVISIAPHISFKYLNQGSFAWHFDSLMVMLTAFGFAVIVPSLRCYLDSDQPLLRRVVFIGSLIPLALYLVWILVVQGLLPRLGSHGLIAISESGKTNSLLMSSIGHVLQSVWLADAARVFVAICAFTSFIGVSVSIMDFISDGLQLERKGKQGVLVYLICFLPPFVIVSIAPGIFISALKYAGICCVILMILLPLLMLYRGRYKLALNQGVDQHKQKYISMVPGGKVILILGLLVGLAIFIEEGIALLH